MTNSIRLTFLVLALAISGISNADDISKQLFKTVDLGELPTLPFDFQKFKSLIDQGANVNYQDETGRSVLYLTTIDHAYLPDTNSEKPLFLQALKILIDHGANVNVQEKAGMDPR